MDNAQKMDALQEAFESYEKDDNRYIIFARFGQGYLIGIGLDAVAIIKNAMVRFPDGSEQTFCTGTKDDIDKKIDAAIEEWKERNR